MLLLSLASFLFANVPDCLAAMEGDVESIVWTSEAQASLLTPQQHKVAFRDVVAEKAIRRVLNVWVASCRSAQVPLSHNVFPEDLLVKDPLPVMETLDFHKTKTGVVDVDFKAWDIQMHGLHNIKVKNLHVLRHMGLQDLRLVIQVEADLNMTGQYTVKGTGLSMVKVSGAGPLSVAVKSLLLTGETFLVIKDENNSGKLQLHIKELELMMTHGGMSVHLDNLMGGGLVGAAGDDILTMVGEDVLEKHKGMLKDLVKKRFREKASVFLDLPQTPFFL